MLEAILDLVFPRRCAACDAPAGDHGHYLCWDCLASVRLIADPFCRLCGNPAGGLIEYDYTCAYCESRPPAFDSARSAALYEGRLRELVQAFKYQRATWLGRDLADLLAACVTTHLDVSRIDAVTAVPLYPRRERERSYNQSALLAAEIARRLDLPLAGHCLARVKYTSSQAGLRATERPGNVRGAFRARHEMWLDGRRLLLVDDVMTTGATVSECARALKEGGASAVHVVTVARGVL